MPKVGIGPFSVEVSGESIEKTATVLSHFNPSVVVAILFAITQVGALVYLQLVIMPANADMIGTKIEPLTKAVSAQQAVHNDTVKLITDHMREQTMLLRDVFTGKLGNRAEANPSGS
jgi:hypothetical protein